MRRIKSALSILMIICMALTFVACEKVEDSGSIGTVNGTQINSQYYRFWTEYLKLAYNNGSPDITEEALKQQFDEERTLAEYIKDEAKTQASEMIILTVKAKEDGFEYSEEEYGDEFKTLKDNFIAQMGGQAAYGEWLKNINVSEATMDAFYKDMVIQDAYLSREEAPLKVSDEEALKYFNENYYVAKHILFAFNESAESADQLVENTDPEATPAPTLTPEEVKAKADKYAQDIKAGKQNFDTVMTELSDDPGTADYPNGYLFKEGDMVTEFYEGTKALQNGQISDPIESAYGYHIIKRLPLDSYPDGFESVKDAITSTISWDKYTAYIEEIKSAMTIEYDDAKINKIAKETLNLK